MRRELDLSVWVSSPGVRRWDQPSQFRTVATGRREELDAEPGGDALELVEQLQQGT